MQNEQYWLMDGRANYSIDEAVVLEICDTIDEAMENLENYGFDTCIVKVDGEGNEMLVSFLEMTREAQRKSKQ